VNGPAGGKRTVWPAIAPRGIGGRGAGLPGYARAPPGAGISGASPHGSPGPCCSHTPFTRVTPDRIRPPGAPNPLVGVVWRRNSICTPPRGSATTLRWRSSSVFFGSPVPEFPQIEREIEYYSCDARAGFIPP